jgi:SAM-dependent methyltransferase
MGGNRGVMAPASQACGFDGVASRYDELWTHTAIGRLQREAVWRQVDPWCPEGSHILDLGCGTGEDALHFSRAGVHVSAYDASREMVRISRGRGVEANVLAIEELERISGTYDGAISNFGALNCVRDLTQLRQPLARLIPAGGFLALCLMGKFCFWETVHFLLRGEIRRAARRWSGTSHSASLGLPVWYPSVREIKRAFAPDFSLVQLVGIGVCVPPSFVTAPTSALLARCDAIDRRVAHRRFFRALSDHRLLLFVRT